MDLGPATSATKTSTTRARRGGRRSKLAGATGMPLSIYVTRTLTRIDNLSPFSTVSLLTPLADSCNANVLTCFTTTFHYHCFRSVLNQYLGSQLTSLISTYDNYTLHHEIIPFYVYQLSSN